MDYTAVITICMPVAYSSDSHIYIQYIYLATVLGERQYFPKREREIGYCIVNAYTAKEASQCSPI